jgi:predicted nucleotidyltransferase
VSFVKAIFLFGGVAQKRANEFSDLDMIIVVDEPIEKVKKKVMSKISELEMNYHIMIEPLILTEEDFLYNVYSSEGGIIYGVAEGFEVLVDKTGKLAKILDSRVEEIRRSHEYLSEARIWLKTIDVLIRVSEVNLARAEKRFKTGEYDSAAFHHLWPLKVRQTP